MQACQLAVVTTPRDSHALFLLGLAQLAQYDNNPSSERSKEARTDACLSFQASIELEDKAQSGEPPELLSSESVLCPFLCLALKLKDRVVWRCTAPVS